MKGIKTSAVLLMLAGAVQAEVPLPRIAPGPARPI